ncbi:MAG: ATP-binding protein [Treponema sp.]|nr:ATP-binding protein [Treponema sp.]MBP3562634.1 ATP-binding protein [Treponema sp.]
MIDRPEYLQKIISKKENGMIKVITGIRRSGKSFLLTDIYIPWLIKNGVNPNNIIHLSLEEARNAQYRNPLFLAEYIRNKVSDNDSMHYVFLDEIQKVDTIKNPFVDNKKSKIGFVDVLLEIMKINNVDLYVTGSNSHMLSSDILSDFRGRGDEIKMRPLTYKEFYNAYLGDKRYAWREYFTYGGLPVVAKLKNHEEKSKYLKDLFENTYIKDILERHDVRNEEGVLSTLLNILSSSVGSLTNPTNIANTFLTIEKLKISPNSITKYMEYFIDAYILHKAERFDIKGRKYIGSQSKFYFADVGLRNARLNFRQTEENHIMENIIYNELIVRGFDVDVGIVEYNQKKDGKSLKSWLEIDFIANNGNNKYYIQSALTISEETKRQQEINSLKRTGDSFKKIVVVKDSFIPWVDENGIYYIGIEDFLLSQNL